MAGVIGLGHVGIYVADMDKMTAFYTDVLGLQVTDHDDNGRITFLSAQPEVEHHEFALVRSDDQTTACGQVSFHVDSLADWREIQEQIRSAGCDFERIVNHGIAFGAYFRDPEGNIVEVYWPTGIDYPQPTVDPIDMSLSDDELMQMLDALPPRKATRPHYYGRDLQKRLVG
jgi:catechol 2,3-dioxygenase-like lactoylglutathione lyase family enzyme